VLDEGPPQAPTYGAYASQEKLNAPFERRCCAEPTFTLLGKAVTRWCWLTASGELRDDEMCAEDVDS
jgi:hypothetical protein